MISIDGPNKFMSEHSNTLREIVKDAGKYLSTVSIKVHIEEIKSGDKFIINKTGGRDTIIIINSKMEPMDILGTLIHELTRVICIDESLESMAMWMRSYKFICFTALGWRV
jgi:hypothetical protein